jgi:hypothetical protein
MVAILFEFSRMASSASVIIASIAMNATISGNDVGKNPIEELTRQHNLVFAGYMVLLMLGALFTYWVWSSGNRVQQAIQADADARIEEAKEGVAKLENDNLKLRGDLQAETGKVAGLQKDAADAKAAQQTVETELAKQRERTAIAERALLQLKESLKDRTILPDQRQTLLRLLTNAPKGRVQIWWVAGESDAYPLALQIQGILKECGWSEVTEHMAVGTTGVGFFIAIHNGEPAPAHAGLLQHAFISVGIALTALAEPDTPVGAVRIYIGRKAQAK